MPKEDEQPQDVAGIRRELEKALAVKDSSDRVVGNAQHGVYAFYDYDGEPIYVGQTSERLRVRIRRHLTNQRTDAVAMNVLDPFEVADIEMWPMHDLKGGAVGEIAAYLNKAEYTVYRHLIEQSTFHAILNEKDIAATDAVDLPDSVRARIVPDDLYQLRKHPDIRIARRASTISNLARVISERAPSKGLRRTLVTQAKRLQHLAETRVAQIGGDFPVELPGEETGGQVGDD